MPGGGRDTTHPGASALIHSIFRVSHWAVVGFGKGMVGSFQSK